MNFEIFIISSSNKTYLSVEIFERNLEYRQFHKYNWTFPWSYLLHPLLVDSKKIYDPEIFLENCFRKFFIKGNSQEKLLVLHPYDLISSLRSSLWQLSVLFFRKILQDLLLDIRRKIHLQSLFQGQLTLE